MQNTIDDIEAVAKTSSNVYETHIAVKDLQRYMDAELSAGRINISEDDASRLKDVGKVLFSKSLEYGGQNVFVEGDSMNSIRNLVDQIGRVGQVRPMIDELGLESEDGYTPSLLCHSVKVGKSAVGNFFDTIQDVGFSSEDEGFQKVLDGYSQMLERTALEGATEPSHRPTKGIEAFGDLFSDEMKDRIARAGQKHAFHTEMRAHAASGVVFGENSDIDSKELVEHSSYMGLGNASYYAQIALAGSVIASRDFVTQVDNSKYQANMMERYLHAADASLNVLAKTDGVDASLRAIYPEADNPSDAFRDDLQVFLDMLPQDVLDSKTNASLVQGLRQFIDDGVAQPAAGIQNG